MLAELGEWARGTGYGDGRTACGVGPADDATSQRVGHREAPVQSGAQVSFGIIEAKVRRPLEKTCLRSDEAEASRPLSRNDRRTQPERGSDTDGDRKVESAKKMKIDYEEVGDIVRRECLADPFEYGWRLVSKSFRKVDHVEKV